MRNIFIYFFCFVTINAFSLSNKCTLRYWNSSIGFSFNKNSELISIGDNFNLSNYASTLEGVLIYLSKDLNYYTLSGGGSYKIRSCNKSFYSDSIKCEPYNGHVSFELGLECKIWNYEEEIMNIVKGRMWYMKFYYKYFKDIEKCVEFLFNQKEKGFNNEQMFWKSMFETHVITDKTFSKLLRIDFYYCEE